jgi:beta-lactamase class A
LRKEIERIGRESGAKKVAAAFYDYETRTAWSYCGDRWFHAASTIKVAILVALFDAVEQDRFKLSSRLHVRNRFNSVVHEEPYRVEASRDANSVVQAAVGRLMKLEDLAHHMITTSSNLATNLLLELIGVEQAQASLRNLGLSGIALRRGVEDERAFEAGINNEVTADGLVQLFRLIQEEKTYSPAAARKMHEILGQQAFRSGIPAGLPEEVRSDAKIAHKTGEMSTVTHDAGLVALPNRQPYAVAILTEWEPSANGRRETLAKISRVIYDYLTETEKAA